MGKKHNGKPVNRSFIRSGWAENFQQYDGIMLPPDQETETSKVSALWKKFKDRVLGAKYYDKEMLKKYEDQTIVAMLNEAREVKKFDTVEACKKYMQNVQGGLNAIFNQKEESNQILNVK